MTPARPAPGLPVEVDCIAELDALLALGEKGCADLTRIQQEALAQGSAA